MSEFTERDKSVFGQVPPDRLVRARMLRQKMSLPEVMIWQRLRPKVNKDFRLRRQVPLLGKLTVDFYYADLKIVFEIDGSTHDGTFEIDAARDRLLRNNGISVVRISARRVLADPDGVAVFIKGICLGLISIQDIE